jgi:hypothetical protein
VIITHEVHLQEELATVATYTTATRDATITVVVRRDALPTPVPALLEVQLATPITRV